MAFHERLAAKEEWRGNQVVFLVLDREDVKLKFVDSCVLDNRAVYLLLAKIEDFLARSEGLPLLLPEFVCVSVVHPPSAQVLQPILIKLGQMDHWGT